MHLPTEPGTRSTEQIDPVCGMSVDPASASGGAHQHAGTTYYFCNPRCRERFAEAPERYLNASTNGAAPPTAAHRPSHPPAHTAGGAAKPIPAAPGTEWTCPMHPEVVQNAPGACPICGMALEPRLPSEHEDNPELADMRRRLVFAVLLTAPLLVLSMGDELLGGLFSGALSGAGLRGLQLLLASPVCLWAAAPFHERAWASVKSGHLNMFTLIGLGVAVSYAFSVVATLVPGMFPEAFRDAHGQVSVYFEAASSIVTLVLLGQVLELKARHRTGAAVRRLLGLAPKTARRVEAGGSELDVPLDQLVVGDLLRVRPGERVPTDGVVVEGSSLVDESMISGEPVPVHKGPGSPLVGGTVNGAGGLLMRAEQVGQKTVIARIVTLVAEAQRSRAPIQRLADRVSSYFVPAVVLTALITFAIWAVFGPAPRLSHALVNAVAVLIIACPCALGLATPISIMVATGRGASLGVLFRNAETIERLREVDTLLVDKTGTLTEGKPRLVGALAAPGVDEAELLRVAASLERHSEHPLAAALVQAARERQLSLLDAADFQAFSGRGVAATLDRGRALVGNQAFLESQGVTTEALSAPAREREERGQTLIYVASGTRLLGALGVTDPIKATSPAALRTLRADGVRVLMLSGDSPVSAQAVARQLGIDEVLAGVLPDQKAEVVRRLQAEGKVVAMAGDGINDAPALALADVGIAMGTGTDVAMQSAGITLVQGDLAGIARARALSRKTMANIRQNLFFAFVYNSIGVPIAGGVLYPLFGTLLSPMLAAAAMSLSSVSVIGNALRLSRARV